MFCKYCGGKIDNDSIYCSHCGQKLNIESIQSIEIPEAVKSKATFFYDNETDIEHVANSYSVDTRIQYNIILNFGDSTNVQLAIAIKELFGWGIYEAKELIKNAPVILKENVPLYQAELMKIRLELAGGKVNITPIPIS